MIDSNNLEKYSRLCHNLIRDLSLDLTGLTVLTECASGGYAYTPLIALAAGAKKVIATGNDSRYGLFLENVDNISKLAPEFGDIHKIEFIKGRPQREKLSEVNLVTNSGFVRPIDNFIINSINSKSAICLMWETWEYRPGEIDLHAALDRSIPVVGTNESFHIGNMYKYPLILSLKLMFELGSEIANEKICLLGSGLTAKLIYKGFKSMNLDVTWFGSKEFCNDSNCIPYEKLNHNKIAFDCVVCAENIYRNEIVGRNGFVNFKKFKEFSPFLKWGHLSGTIDQEDLRNSGISYYPKKILPAEYMSYETQVLGYRPILELNSQGLKVGEIVAKARINGKSVEESIQLAVDFGIGMNFPGGFRNFTKSLS